MKPLIAPSILTAPFSKLYTTLQMLELSEADFIHCDVMDGLFVPNITFGMPIIAEIKKNTSKPLDVHLMIVQPERYIKAFKDAGANILTIHQEACIHLERTLHQIKDENMQAGVALNPSTPIDTLQDVIHLIDLVLIMSVNPGFGGQKFIERTYRKICRVKELILKENTSTLIEVDGGVTDTNALQLVEAGADILVAGNYVFSSTKPFQAIRTLKEITNTSL
jgi:ribulose-phosphate 3-epimerase